MSSNSHLFTDADNTLWDTDAVFATAQLEMLREIERITGQNAPEDGDRGLAFLRNIDQQIAASHPDHLRYPPRLLARSLALVLEGQDVGTVIARVIEPDVEKTGRFEEVHARFLESVRRLPPLRAGVREGLHAISKAHVPITVVTEERVERCREFLAGHGLKDMINDIVSVRKTIAAFLALQQRSRTARCFMVGDQLDRDIEAAAAAGFSTFYFPGGFLPYWIWNFDRRGSKQITRYDEIVADVLAGQD